MVEQGEVSNVAGYSHSFDAFDDLRGRYELQRPLPFNASAQTLKVTDMPSSRCLFRLVPSEPPTDETGCSSSQGDCEMLPTHQTTDWNTPLTPKQKADYAKRYEGKGVVPSCTYQLRQMAADGLLPTPQTQGLKVCDKNGKTQFIDLSLLPTPTAGEALKWRNQLDFNSQMGQALNALGVNGLLPTPIASDGEAGGSAAIRKDTGKVRIDCLRHLVACLVAVGGCGVKPGTGSRLNPLYTEEMMGFPLMWTALPFLSESGAPKPSKPTATP